VAAASTYALGSVAHTCTLYTDLRNPTSNRIYQAIGYRPVADVTTWRFTR
jgi:predicted GNAT family acetyltransferase